MTLRESYVLVSKLRGVARPNSTFLKDLIKFEKEVLGKTSAQVIKVKRDGKTVEVPDFLEHDLKDKFDEEFSHERAMNVVKDDEDEDKINLQPSMTALSLSDDAPGMPSTTSSHTAPIAKSAPIQQQPKKPEQTALSNKFNQVLARKTSPSLKVNSGRPVKSGGLNFEATRPDEIIALSNVPSGPLSSVPSTAPKTSNHQKSTSPTASKKPDKSPNEGTNGNSHQQQQK